MTGLGGGILIIDDFQKPQDMDSQARRTSTNSLYYKTMASRTDNQHTGAIVVVGQRLGPDDLIGNLLCSAEKWTTLILTAIAEKEEAIPIGLGRTHLRRVGDLLHPEQQSRAYLEALKIQDPETYAAQYQQSPIPPGGFIIKRNQIAYCDELPRRTSSSLYFQSWDTAFKVGDSNSRSACLDILLHDNKYFIARALAGQWQYQDLEQRVLALHVVAVKPEGDKKSRLLCQNLLMGR